MAGFAFAARTAAFHQPSDHGRPAFALARQDGEQK
jgi:hypothetical protein